MFASASKLAVGVLVRLTAKLIITKSDTAAHKFKALNCIRLSANRHITLLQQSCNYLLHVIEVVRSIDLSILIIGTGRVEKADSFTISKLKITVRF